MTDYLKRSEARIKSLDTLYTEKDWADVVREAQEVVELALKALLRYAHVEVPRIHDVGDILQAQSAALPAQIQGHLSELIKISRSLRRDRELAFYGTEDLTPSEFYKQEDATLARDQARWVVQVVIEVCRPKG